MPGALFPPGFEQDRLAGSVEVCGFPERIAQDARHLPLVLLKDRLVGPLHFQRLRSVEVPKSDGLPHGDDLRIGADKDDDIGAASRRSDIEVLHWRSPRGWRPGPNITQADDIKPLDGSGGKRSVAASRRAGRRHNGDLPKMAKTLEANTATSNVTKLPTRAARGAGKSKPTKPTVKLPDAVPAGRPQLKSEDRLRESLQLQIVGYTAQHRAVDAEIAVLQEEVKGLNARKKQIRTAIKTAGMPLELFDESYKDAGTSRVDLDLKEKLRSIVREAHGLMIRAQADLLKDLPEGARGAVYWESQGYQDGIGGKFASEGSADCPPEHRNDYLRGHGNAMKANAEGIKAVEKVADAPKDVPGDTTVIPEDEGQTDVETAIEQGAEAIDKEIDADPAEGPELEGAPETEPSAEPVLH